MLVHPQFDPVALSLGPLAIRWYGLMYVVAFAQFWWLARRRIAARPELGWTSVQLDDLLFYGAMGIILGGRLGEVLFYQPLYYFSHPFEILAVWKGGMSFHGGFCGLLAALALWSRRYQQNWLDTTDFIAPLVPLGLMAGRLGNFINGELWGRLADPSLPWAMVFPPAGPAPRHPSQLYHAGLEGLALFLILWFYSRQARPRGAVSALFLIGYGGFRFLVEFFREPDAGIFGQSYAVSMGQWLSLPMILGGIVLFVLAQRRHERRNPA